MLSKKNLAVKASEKYRELLEQEGPSEDDQLFLYLMDTCAAYHRRVDSLIRRKQSQEEAESLDEVFEELETVQGLLMDIIESLRLLGYSGPVKSKDIAIWASRLAQVLPTEQSR